MEVEIEVVKRFPAAVAFSSRLLVQRTRGACEGSHPAG